MSSNIKRRLRQTNQNEKIISLKTHGKSILLDSTKIRGSNFSSMMDFDSETLSSSSSPKRVDDKPEKKARRKKIRSTQDFNELSCSMTSQDSHSSAKIKTKRAKKVKKIDYVLPKIGKVIENVVPDATLNKGSTAKRRRGRRISKNCNEEQTGDSFTSINNKPNQFDKAMQLEYVRPEKYVVNRSLVDSKTFDFEIQSGKMKMTNLVDKNKSIVENRRTNNSISIDQGNLEVDVTTKSKRRLAKKDMSEIMDTEAENRCTENKKIIDSEINKKRKSVLNKSNLSNEESNVNLSSFNGEISIKHLNKTCNDDACQNKKCVSSKLITKQKINEIDVQLNNSNSITLTTDSRNHKIEENSNKGFMLTDGKRDVCNFKISGRTRNRSEVKNRLSMMKERQSKIGVRSKSLASNIITSPVKTKRQKTGNNKTFELEGHDYNDISSRNNIGSEGYVGFDDNIGSDDIFDRESTEGKKNKLKEHVHQIEQPNNAKWDYQSTKIETGKSVHFLFSEDKVNVQRDTFNIKESTFDVTTLESSVSPSQNIIVKDDGAFEINKSIASNQSAVQCNDWSGSQPRSKDIELPSPIYSISTTESKSFIRRGTNASVGANFSENMPRINSENTTLSGENRTETFQTGRNRSFRKSVIDLITPDNKKSPMNTRKDSSDVIFLEEVSNKKKKKGSSMMKLNRRSTFSKTVEVPENDIPKKFTRSPLKLSNSFNRTFPLHENVQTPSKLNRSVTYVKDDIQGKDLHNDKYVSPLLFDTSNVIDIDTSKVNKRRRWNKSLASVSFLDSPDIGNISAPWSKDILNVTWEKSPAKDQANSSSEKKGTPKTVKDIRATESSKRYINFESPIVKKTVSCYRTPPTNTSTPLPDYRNILSRQVFMKDKQNVTINETKNCSKVADKPPKAKLIRTKMPNFALIHQRAYDKLENLKEMSERKAARAKLLLSGHKPTDENSLRSSKCKKLLNLSPIKSKILSLNESRKKAENSVKSNILVTKIKNVSPSKSNPKVVNKENKSTLTEKKKLLKSSQIPKLKVPNIVAAEKKGFTKYGFKVGSNSLKTATKEEQMRAISTKTKIIKNTVQERRNAIQGVRSNRRFDLLMSMRNK